MASPYVGPDLSILKNMMNASGNADMTPRENDAVEAARLYYDQQLTMSQIADRMGVSRSSISRMLSFARDEALVRISVAPPMTTPEGLGRVLTRFHGVPIQVIESASDPSDARHSRRVAGAAARRLEATFHSNMNLGVSVGAMTTAVSIELLPRPLQNVWVVELNGVAAWKDWQHTDGAVLMNYGQKFDARVERFPVPALFDDPWTKAAMWRERSVQRLLRIRLAVDIAIFGVESLQGGRTARSSSTANLSKQDRKSLVDSGVVGSIGGMFYRADGSTLGIDVSDRGSALESHDLRRIARRICVAVGEQHAMAVQGALAGRFITDLIIDGDLGRALLDQH